MVLLTIVKLNYYCVDISHLPEIREVACWGLDPNHFGVGR